MKQIYLLRHAKSDWNDPELTDFDRPLNARGRKSAQRMAEYLRRRRIAPATILCSPAKRTCQTLKLLAPALGDAPVSFDRRLYEALPRTLQTCLRDLPEDAPSVLMICHNPGIEQLVRLLTGGQGAPVALDRLAEKFPTCGLALLSMETGGWRDLGPGSCRLDGFIRPIDVED